ncbi:MAG: thiamine pyrophosphate-dependent enzyme [Promethearchaeota archaeon]
MKLSELFEDSPGKEVLISGNEAFARGIFESGVGFASNYPGTPLSEVGDYLNYLSEIKEDFTFDYSLNEKVALESAIGASWAGIRSISIFKHLGLNVCADPLHTFPYAGVNSGMLILCGGDPAILSSTNAQDNRLYSMHTKIPILEPGTVQECKDYIKEGIRLSEIYKIPVYIHVNTRLCHSYGKVIFGEITSRKNVGEFIKNADRFVNTRGRAMKNQKNFFKKVANLAKNKKFFHIFNMEKVIEKNDDIDNIGILTSGICYSYIIQACRKLGINPPILKLGLIFPINREEICNFANKYDLKKLLIVEELEPFLEIFSKRVFCNFCDAKRELEIHGKDFLPNTGELNTDIVIQFFEKHFELKDRHFLEEIREKEQILREILPTLPPREPTFCPGCPYRPVFYSLKKISKELKKEKGLELIYGGDIGCYTLSEAYPYELIDWVICMGAGIGISDGMALTTNPKKQKLIAYVGDSTLYHTGLQPLLNAIKNNIDLTIIIFNNYWTAMTGHQEFIATPDNLIDRAGTKSKTEQRKVDLIQMLKSFNIQNLTITGAYNVEKLKRIFKTEILKTGVKVIVINEECALEKNRRLKRKQKKAHRKKESEIFYFITDSCVKCNECIEILGCPAISAKIIGKSDPGKEIKKEDLIYYIDENMCLSKICPGVCKSICPNNCIKKTILNPDLEEKN